MACCKVRNAMLRAAKYQTLQYTQYLVKDLFYQRSICKHLQGLCTVFLFPFLISVLHQSLRVFSVLFTFRQACAKQR